MSARKDHTMHEVLRQIPYGLFAVGVRNKNVEELNATVVSWVTQCSFNPPMLMIAIRKPSKSYDLIKDGKVFSLNMIGKGGGLLIKQLVKPKPHGESKLGRISHVEEDTGAPILRKAFAYLECKVRSIEEPGDHAIVIGEVVNAGFHGTGFYRTGTQ